MCMFVLKADDRICLIVAELRLHSLIVVGLFLMDSCARHTMI